MDDGARSFNYGFTASMCTLLNWLSEKENCVRNDMSRPESDSNEQRTPEDTHQNKPTPFDDELEIFDEDLIAIKNELMDFAEKDSIDESRQPENKFDDEEDVAQDDSVNEMHNDENIHEDSLAEMPFLGFVGEDSDGVHNQIEDNFETDDEVDQDDSEYETMDIQNDSSADMTEQDRAETEYEREKYGRSVTCKPDKLRSFQCPDCNRICKNSSQFKSHMMLHTEEKPHQCKYCEKTFASKHYLYVHLRKIHRAKPYRCETCKESFEMMRELKHHMNSKHKINSCPYCGKYYDSRSNLIEHVRTHTGEKPFRCNECGGSFITASRLNQHLRQNHGIAPYNCSQCTEKFDRNRELIDHMKTSH